MTFPHHTIDTAPASAKATLIGMTKEFGFLPAAAARMSNSPELLHAFTRSNALFERTTLTPLQRETLVMTLAVRNGCHVCIAMHTAMLTRSGADPELVAALRDQRELPEPALEALRRFTISGTETAGGVPDEQIRDFLAHGYTEQNALEVVLGVGTYTFSTFANRMTDSPVDSVFAEFAAAGARRT